MLKLQMARDRAYFGECFLAKKILIISNSFDKSIQNSF